MEHTGSRIGIGITTRDRTSVLEYTLRQFDKYTPAEIKIVIIDDNSKEGEENRKVAEAYGEYYYNEVRLGVAKSKNECIKKLDTDHIFLFDDDCFPVRDEWWKPWLVGEHHMVFSPGKGVRKLKEQSKEVEGGLGCCLYFSRECLDTVGGFDPDFGMWGYEHAEITNRIFCAGLTSYTYLAPLEANVFSFDYSGDHGDFKWINRGCMDNEEKALCAKANEAPFHKAVAKMRTGDIKRVI